MSRWKYSVLSVAMLLVHAQAQAQAQPQASASAGTLVVVPAFGEVVRENDLAIATLMIEEQDRDKAQAASRVNVKMKQGTEIVKRADPQAVLKTRGYYTYPVYPEERPVAVGAVARARVPTSWRVGQYLDMKTANLAALPKTIAAVQSVLAVNALNFGLAPDTGKQLDAQRIAATFLNLRERIAAIAAAMGRTASDAVLELVDVDASGSNAQQEGTSMPMMMKSASPEAHVAEPSFEPGETTLQMRLVAKVRFK